MMMKDSLFLRFQIFYEGVWGQGGGPLMMMNDSLFLLISKVLERGCGAGTGPTNDNEGFYVSTDFKCFRKGVWDWGEGQVLMTKDSFCF